MLSIRHALSKHNADNVDVLDFGDPDLHPVGKIQVQETTRALLRHGGVEVIVAADSRRAIQTAEPMAKTLGALLVVDDRLNEFGWGIDAGRPKREVFTTEVQALADAEGDAGWDFRLNPAADTRREAALRYISATEDIQAEFPDQAVALVGSSFTTKCALAYLQGIEASDARKLPFTNAEVLAYDPTNMGSPRSIFIPETRLF